MNLQLYFHLARRWILLAILPALLIAAAGYYYTAREPKTYETSTVLYVQQPSSDATVPGSTDVYTSQALIPTYSQMIAAPVIAQAVNHRMATLYPGYNLAAHGLKVAGAGSLPGATVQNTQLMNVTVTDTNPRRAAASADSVAAVFIHQIVTIQKARYKGGAQAIQKQLNQEEANIQIVSARIQSYSGPSSGLANLKAQLNAYESIYQTLLASEQQFGVTRNTALNSVKVFSPAPVPTSPTGPHPVRTGLLWGFVALLICAGGIFLYDYYDDSPRTPEEIEGIIEAPILGTVRKFDASKGGSPLVAAHRATSPETEAYQMIRTNLEFTDVDKPPRTIVVTSPSIAEGKSTTAANLAYVFANTGKQVALIDADLRRPSQHRVFGLARHDGLTNLLVGTDELNGHGRQHYAASANLEIIASGPLPPRPADLLGSARMRQLVSHVSSERDLVILDTPPVLAVTDAAILSTATDGVVLVVDPGKSKRRDLRRAREAIEVVGGRILGIVINRLSKSDSAYYYYYYQHNYGYQYRYDYAHATEREQEVAAR